MAMGKDDRSDIGGELRIGPTDQAMVRIHVTADDGADVPLDFDPDEADAIAEELRAAADVARGMARPRERR
jgi:hypothetical protein